MKALITGASSGIGRDMAIVLSKMGIELILVARREDRLNALKKSLPTKAQIIPTDLSIPQNCFELYDRVKSEKIDILINNAGFGLFGSFDETDITKELELINTNINSLHILTKLFAADFKHNDFGYILNVASIAAFLPGPLMSAYYASKAYVLRYSEALQEELRRTTSNVSISVLCPGPVKTEFNDVANVKFSVSSLTSKYVAEYAVKKMFKRKLLIIPGKSMKFVRFIERFSSEKQLMKSSYHMQKRKTDMF